jgi:hypothetical protein
MKMSSGRINVAVIVGGHHYPVFPMHEMFDQMPDVYPYFMNLETMCYSGYDRFDAFLFYNRDQWFFYEPTPDAPEALKRQMNRIHERTEAGLERIVKNGQGIFVLHHAMHCFLFPESDPRWGRILNMDNFMYRGVSMADVHTEIANPEHPITKGLEAWDMKDEVFLMDDPNEGSDILLTTENPESMRALGWTHTLNDSRVFCYQSGHSGNTLLSPNVSMIIHRGIQWITGRI